MHPRLTKLPLRLDIGAGGYPRGDEFTTVDAYHPADLKAEMWSLPLPDNSAEEIWSSHTLEHCPASRISETLKEWLRVLKPGGRLIVQVPNFDYVAKYWLTGPNREWAEQLVFGQQTNEGEFHKSAHTPATIKADLEGNGWVVDRVEFRYTHSQETIQAVAHKPKASNGVPVR